MPTAPPQSINTHQQIRIHVSANNFDGNLDPNVALAAASTNNQTATATIAPDDPRAVDIVSGNQVASCNIIVSQPGAPAGGQLTIPVNVSAAPDLRSVGYVSSDAPTLKS